MFIDRDKGTHNHWDGKGERGRDKYRETNLDERTPKQRKTRTGQTEKRANTPRDKQTKHAQWQACLTGVLSWHIVCECSLWRMAGPTARWAAWHWLRASLRPRPGPRLPAARKRGALVTLAACCTRVFTIVAGCAGHRPPRMLAYTHATSTVGPEGRTCD